MHVRIVSLAFIALVSLSLAAAEPPREGGRTCEPLKSVIKRAGDDVCEAIESAAQNCFKRLNGRYSKLKKHPGTSREMRLNSVSELKRDHEAGLTELSRYNEHLKKIGNACLNQTGALEVWVEEIQKDLTDLKRPGF